MLRFACIFVCVCLASAIPTTNLSPKERASQLVSQMTLEEKISMLHGTNGPFVGNVAGVDRLGIPMLKMGDGPQGFRAADNLPGTSTAFPSGLSIAATFDPEAAFIWGDAMGHEFRDKGANVQLGPGLNVARVPRNGRNFEYMSGEDPHLGRALSKRAVEGIQQNLVIANAKHYINNNEETNRMNVSEDIDERTEWEIYMPPFQGAIEGGVLSVMCSYNRINSIWACENNETLNTDLKGRLGFQGWVMSDWGATHTTELAANSGLDQQMPDDQYFGAALIDAVKTGRVAEASIDDKVFRIIYALITVGAFDSVSHGDYRNNVTSDAHNKIARDLAARSTVLLKNEKILPLDVKQIKKIAVIGDAGHLKPVVAGGGSGHVEGPYIIDGLLGIQNRVSGHSVEVTYTPTASLDAAKAAAAADIAIVFVGTNSCEGSDRPNLSLPKEEEDLIVVAADAQPNTIVVVSTPGALLMPWAKDVKAILTTFMSGQEMGNAVADILFGDFAPTGRLPLTIPNVENEVGFTPEEYPGLPVNEPLHAQYAEKLLVGYRWYNAMKVNPLFCFGHGLTYSEFEYKDLVVTRTEYGLHATVVVTNIGPVSAADVAQLYLTFPESAGEPPRQLKDFGVTPVLSQNASAVISFNIGHQDLSIWDVNVHHWKLLSGESFSVEVGRSSCDLRVQTSVVA